MRGCVSVLRKKAKERASASGMALNWKDESRIDEAVVGVRETRPCCSEMGESELADGELWMGVPLVELGFLVGERSVAVVLVVSFGTGASKSAKSGCWGCLGECDWDLGLFPLFFAAASRSGELKATSGI